MWGVGCGCGCVGDMGVYESRRSQTELCATYRTVTDGTVCHRQNCVSQTKLSQTELSQTELSVTDRTVSQTELSVTDRTVSQTELSVTDRTQCHRQNSVSQTELGVRHCVHVTSVNMIPLKAKHLCCRPGLMMTVAMVTNLILAR